MALKYEGDGNRLHVYDEETGNTIADLQNADDVQHAAQFAAAPQMKGALEQVLRDISDMVGDVSVHGCKLEDEQHPWYSIVNGIQSALDAAKPAD